MKTDLKKLEDELYRNGLAGFRCILGAHPKDEFYCFAFYTNGEFTYVAITASTYEGLEIVAQDYKEKPTYQAMSIEDLRLDLKWSPCDSPLHGAAEHDQALADRIVHRCAGEPPHGRGS